MPFIADTFRGADPPYEWRVWNNKVIGRMEVVLVRTEPPYAVIRLDLVSGGTIKVPISELEAYPSGQELLDDAEGGR